MPVLPSKELEKYKTYYNQNVKGKDGVTRPLTKVKYIKTCPQCGGLMDLNKYKPGGTHLKPFIRWLCADVKCAHSEREQSTEEYLQNQYITENGVEDLEQEEI